MKRWRLGALVLALSCMAASGLATSLNVYGGDITAFGDTSSFIFGLYTWYPISPSYASLTEGNPSSGPASAGHLVIWADGVAYDIVDSSSRTTVSPMSINSGAFLSAVYDLNAVGLRITVHYEPVNNPQTGARWDTMKIKVVLQNTGTIAITYGVRLMIDTKINGLDGANLSLDNGLSMVANNSIFTQTGTGVPGNWWGFDIPPPGTPALVGRGSVWGNPLGDAADMPDALEVAQSSDTNGLAQWTPAPLGGAITNSSVVLWWTGSGSATAPVMSLAAGASRSFVTYYGINDGPLLTSFTPTKTPSPTPTITPTLTPTPPALTLRMLPPNPGPASTEVWLPYCLGADANVDIQVWTIAGEKLRAWSPGPRLTGCHEERWDLCNQANRAVGSGVYIYRIRAVSAYNGETEQAFSKCAVAR